MQLASWNQQRSIGSAPTTPVVQSTKIELLEARAKKEMENTKENRISVFPQILCSEWAWKQRKDFFPHDEAKTKELRLRYVRRRKGKNVQTKTRWKFPARFFMMLFIRRRLVSPFISPTGEDLSRTHDTISPRPRLRCQTPQDLIASTPHLMLMVMSLSIFHWNVSAAQSHSVLLWKSRVKGKVIKSAKVTVRVSLYLEAKSFPQFLLFPVYDQQHRPEILKHPRSCDLSCLTFQIIIRWFIVQTCVIPLFDIAYMYGAAGCSPKYCKSLCVRLKTIKAMKKMVV